ncbi:MAG TPA: alpha/beta fold hydrolase, partial [Pseudomonadales bacterium]
MSHALKQDFLPLAYSDWPAANADLPWLVLLHGWGTDSSAWESCRAWQEHFRVRTIDLPGFGDSAVSAWPGIALLLAQLEELLPERCTLIGWSMGGQIATLLAKQCPQQVERLVLVASNPHFLAVDHWPGMDADTAATFRNLMEGKGVAGLKRFAMLVAHGDLRERHVMETLHAHSRQAPDEKALLASLGALESLDTRDALKSLPMPVLHLLGEADQLVPASLAKTLRREYPKHAVQVLPALAHAPFISDPQAVFNALHDHERKHAVAQRFSHASGDYDAAAGVQQKVIQQMLQVMPALQGA